jgi:hypothetical protein
MIYSLYKHLAYFKTFKSQILTATDEAFGVKHFA